SRGTIILFNCRTALYSQSIFNGVRLKVISTNYGKRLVHSGGRWARNVYSDARCGDTYVERSYPGATNGWYRQRIPDRSNDLSGGETFGSGISRCDECAIHWCR